MSSSCILLLSGKHAVFYHADGVTICLTDLTQRPPVAYSAEINIECSPPVHRLGISESAQIVIGACMLTSARSAGFWLRLCHAAHLDGAKTLVDAFGRAEEAGKSAVLQHGYDYIRQQIAQVIAVSALNTFCDVT